MVVLIGDGDLVIDRKDKCPDEKGRKKWAGCPTAPVTIIPDKGNFCQLFSYWWLKYNGF